MSSHEYFIDEGERDGLKVLRQIQSRQECSRITCCDILLWGYNQRDGMGWLIREKLLMGSSSIYIG